LEGEEVITDVEVIENSDELLILGNDWIRKNVKNIDIENKKMRIKGRYETHTILLELTRENDEEEYEDEDLDEVYCWLGYDNTRKIYATREEKEVKYKIGKLTDKQREKVKDMIQNNEDIFIKRKYEVGRTNVV